jgi:hypothetical protein
MDHEAVVNGPAGCAQALSRGRTRGALRSEERRRLAKGLRPPLQRSSIVTGRQVSAPRARQPSGPIPAGAGETPERMANAVDGSIAAKDTKRHADDRAFHEKDGMIHPGDRTIHEKDGMIHLGDRTIHEKDGTIHPGDRTIHEKDGMIHLGDRTIHEKDGTIHPGDRTIHEKDGMIHPGDRTIHEKDGTIHLGDRTIHEKHGTIDPTMEVSTTHVELSQAPPGQCPPTFEHRHCEERSDAAVQ